ncbi:MAG: hypothetical protein ACOH2J_18530 [Allorhizobium sp.]
MGAFRLRQKPAEPDLDLLPPERVARPAQRRPFHLDSDISDAEFVTVRDAPRRQFDPRRCNDNIHSSARFDDVRVARKRPGPVARLVQRGEAVLGLLSDTAFAIMVALIFICVFSLVGGLAGLGIAQASGADGKPGLDLTHVSLTPQDANGMRLLVINAIVENRGTDRKAVPMVRADLISNGQLIARTLITAPVDAIDGGHSRGFSARLQHPGGKIPELRLSFADMDASRS